MKTILKTLLEGRSLARSEAARAMRLIMSGTPAPEQIAAFLAALSAKGETAEEIAGLVETMREHAVRVHARRRDLLDNCGTGGDQSGTFNISTAASLVLAAAGAAVAKHGNRSVSSSCGSADILEHLGVPVRLGPEAAARSIDTLNFAFLFAPLYHPSLKHAGPVRKAIGVRTVFNLLGPLANPAGVKRQVVGVYDRKFHRPLAEVLRGLGTEEAMIVTGESGVDEISLSGETAVTHLKDGDISVFSIKPEDFGLERKAPEAVSGGSVPANAAILTELFSGKKGPYRDVVALNAAAGFWVSGIEKDMKNGIALAGRILDSGKAAGLLDRLRDFKE
ncbi:MAG TPA: anthranilate phosphoribosyltransferase [Elusimicrobiales bacterium]|nr:anthranilate phosphoribosyltransferase [Elusimicrobiales bacterium]